MPVSNGAKPSFEDKLAEWWGQSNTKNILLPAAQSAMPYLPGGMLSNLVQAEGENLVNLAGGQITPSQAYEHSPIAQGFVEPIADFSQMVGQALSDPGSLYDIDQTTGEAHIGQGPIEAAAGGAMMVPMAGIGSALDRGVLASGPKFGGHPSSGEWMKAHPDYAPPPAHPDYAPHPDYPTVTQEEPFQQFGQNYEPPLATPLEYLTGDELAHLQGQGYDESMVAGMSGEEVYKALGDTGFSYTTPADLLPGGIYPTAPHGMSYDPSDVHPFDQYIPKSFDEQHGLKTLGDGSALDSEALDHLMDQGLSDAQISSMSMDEAQMLLENTGYYPDVLGGESWAPPNNIYGHFYIKDGIISEKDYNTLGGAGYDPDNMTVAEANAALPDAEAGMMKGQYGKLPVDKYGEPSESYSFDPGFDDFDNPQYMKSQAIDVAQGLFGNDTGKIQDFLLGKYVGHGPHTYHVYDEVSEPIGGYLDTGPTPAELKAQELFPGDMLAQVDFLKGHSVMDADGNIHDLTQHFPNYSPPKVGLAQKPFYGTGSQETDDLIAKANKKGWDPHALAGKFTAGELDLNDLKFHAGVNANNTPKDMWNHLKQNPPGKLASDPLALKPLDTKKYPWMSQVDPLGNSAFLDPNRSELFRPYVEAAHMQDIDIRKEIETLFKKGPEYDQAKREATDRLYDIRAQSESLPPRSPVVPWAFNTRDPDWLDRAKALTLSPETKAKAAALGLDPEQIYWKGTKYPEQRLLDPSGKPNAQMLYWSKHPEVGGYYGDWVYPGLLRMDNPAIIDKAGTHYDEGWMKRFVQDALAAGHTSAIAKNMSDVGGIQDQFMIAHPKYARSPWAEFNPARKEEGDLLAAASIPFNPFDFLAQTEEQRRRNARL